MTVNANIAWIRRFVLRLVTTLEHGAGARSTSSPAVQPPVVFESGCAPESAEPGAGDATGPPWATGMAEPSFMIVSPRLPRR
ncbi:hypothetical protein ACIGFK_31305 [Streptomyces sp. NPDC085524]|uniref:hypothetical protein n=1 Tax=unclassified Streptomyces TaxID=2593676 RepID=UPI0035DA7DE7